MKLHVLMACHNRKELTVRAIESAKLAAERASLPINFVVFDDGSSDGTAIALGGLNANITLVEGDGEAYWAKSMESAERVAFTHVNPEDWLVWLNDDVVLDPNAFEVYIQWASSQSYSEAVFVGAMADPKTGLITYGGLRKSGIHPLRFELLSSTAEPVLVDSFNGNLVFVPVRLAKRLGSIDGAFSHALADIDYGLRCQKAGVPVVLLPGVLGLCTRDSDAVRRGIYAEWKRYRGVKGGGHYASLSRILRKNSPNSWWLYIGATYALWWGRQILGAIRDKAKVNS